MKNLTLRNITDACEGTYMGDPSFLDFEIDNVTSDSRTVSKDSLFIAIKGQRVDGHDFIKTAFNKGALCCISEKYIPDITEPIIIVNSATTALKQIAKFYRSCLNIPIIGITGSVGKTSTKEMLACVLSEKFNVLKTLKNFNNEIGLPQTLLRIRDEHEVAVVEMGINHFGEMSRLSDIARPDLVVMTNVGPCHLENLIDLDGVLKAKSEVFEYMNPNGLAFLNGDEKPLSDIRLVNGKSPIFFGFNSDNDYYAEDISEDETGLNCTIRNKDWSLPVRINIPGRHMIYHALTAAAIGRYFKLDDQMIAHGISKLQPVDGRNNKIDANGISIIDDCYNANPISMKGSIETLSKMNTRKICILGDMFELGKDEKQLHYDVGSFVGSKNIDLLITVGELASFLGNGAADKNPKLEIISYKEKETLLKELPLLIQEGDTVLLKASHGMQFSSIVELLRSDNFHPRRMKQL